ncbi:MAG: PrgI family protein [Lachnospiraceae bacterium]|nr:PrgI family protein [Lachnospiraceae bacterium]
MRKIRINKDFVSEYKNNVYKGFNVRELITIACGLPVGVIVGYFLYKKVGLDIQVSTYAGVACVVPIAYIGMYKFQGYLELISLFKEMIYQKKTKELTFISPEENYKNEKVFLVGKNRKEKSK